jgi:hypothetical protein
MRIRHNPADKPLREVAERSAALLDRIEDAQALEDLVEGLLDAADGEAWLVVLKQAAG